MRNARRLHSFLPFFIQRTLSFQSFLPLFPSFSFAIPSFSSSFLTSFVAHSSFATHSNANTTAQKHKETRKKKLRKLTPLLPSLPSIRFSLQLLKTTWSKVCERHTSTHSMIATLTIQDMNSGNDNTISLRSSLDTNNSRRLRRCRRNRTAPLFALEAV